MKRQTIDEEKNIHNTYPMKDSYLEYTKNFYKSIRKIPNKPKLTNVQKNSTDTSQRRISKGPVSM